MSGERNIFLILAAAGIILSGICVFCTASVPERLYRPDSPGYLRPARDLAAGRGYTTTERPPGYPLAAAAIYRCGGSDAAVAWFGWLCMLGGCALTAAAARTYGGPRCGRLAGLLALFNLTLIANAPLLLSDTMFFLFAALQFRLLAQFLTGGRPGFLYGCAAVAAAASLIRPVNQFFLLPLLVLVLCRMEQPWRRKAVHVAVAAGIFLAVILPWMWRNHAVGAVFAIDTNTGAMRHQNGAMLLAEVNGTDFESEKARLLAEEAAKTFPTPRAREQWRIREFLNLVAAHPFLYLRQHLNWEILLPDAPTLLEDFGITTPNRGTMGVLKKSGPAAALRHYFGPGWMKYLLFLLPLLTITLVLYAGAFLQLLRDLRHLRTAWPELLLFLACVEYYLFLPGAITAPRYQLPALPFLCTLCGVFLAESWSKFRSRALKSAA